MTTSPAPIRQITAPELKAMLTSGTPFELWDVRTEAERQIARIEGARYLDQHGVTYLEGLETKAGAGEQRPNFVLRAHRVAGKPGGENACHVRESFWRAIDQLRMACRLIQRLGRSNL